MAHRVAPTAMGGRVWCLRAATARDVCLPLILAAILLVVSGGAPAQTPLAIERPELKLGDSWSYQRTDLLTNTVTGKYTTEIVAKTEKGYQVRHTVDGNVP